MTQLKILLNGRACAGKDSVAERLYAKWGFSVFSFAEGIYEIAYKYFSMTEKDRALLQAIGQKMREISPTVWVDATYNKADEEFNEAGFSVVITDCRQANEYLKGVDLCYIPIRITASLENRIRRTLIRDKGIKEDNPSIDIMVKHIINGETEPHQFYHIDISKWENESENGADNFKYIEIENNGTIYELHEKIDNIVLRLMEEKNLAKLAGLW